jgi:ribonucleoside-diphosphate reductase alpha chain
MNGPQTPFADFMHATKYRAQGESFDEAMNRQAGALTDGTEAFHAYRNVIRPMKFMAGGRIQAAVGSPKRVTPYNCFVSGEIYDSFIDGHGSIMARATEAAQTMRMGGGIGYDFSGLRPRGAEIKKLGSMASGPVSFMQIYDALCKCIASSGHRRGAQMGVLRVDHPDIVEFVHCKQNDHNLTGFNISIGITDEFMRAVESETTFDLRFKGKTYSTIDAKALWEKIMRSTWDWAEPGVLFIDAINDRNNLWYCESIGATNPCGEQPLPPYGACLLGSFNLTKYLRDAPGYGSWEFDWDGLKGDIAPVVGAMDRVVDVATYPMFEQEQEAHNKRRMGLGVTGLANAGEALGARYGREQFLEFEERVLITLRDEAYIASAYLAKERGSFPLFDRDKFLEGSFAQTLPGSIRDLIATHGMRNSHLTSIAPTGTISLCADNVSSGIEPTFSNSIRRTVQMWEGPEEHVIEDYAYANLGIVPTEAVEVTAEEHLAVLTTAQRFVDSSVSKTCNVSPDMEWEDFKAIYMQAWKGGAKGCTTFNAGGKRMGILKDDAAEEEGLSCTIDANGRRDCE